MAQKEIKNKILKLLKCSVSAPEDEHLCENPLMLSCGHYICKECLQPNVSHSTVKCNTCGEQNEKDLNQKEKQVAFHLLFEQNINELFKINFENFQNAFKVCKDMIYNNNEERIDNHIQFIKDNILLRVESVKIELDNLYETFNKELDEIGKKWKLESKNIKFEKFEAKTFENELKELEKSIDESKDLNEKIFYKYQNQTKKIQQIIKEYNDDSPKLEFRENEARISKEIIGEIIFDIKNVDIELDIIKRIKTNKFEQINAETQYDLCKLSNGYLLTSNPNNSTLFVYDDKMQLLRKIISINEKKYGILGMASDEKNNIYMCGWSSHYVIKTDLNCNQLAIFGTGAAGNAQNQVNGPVGVCYYNQFVYVCDYYNKRIQKLNSDLHFQASFPLNYEPLYIKNIKNIAIVRPCNEASIYFYDLNNFNMLKKYGAMDKT